MLRIDGLGEPLGIVEGAADGVQGRQAVAFDPRCDRPPASPGGWR